MANNQFQASEEIATLVAACGTSKPTEIRDAFAVAIASKVAERIDVVRQSVATEFFGGTNQQGH